MNKEEFKRDVLLMMALQELIERYQVTSTVQSLTDPLN